MNFLEPGREVLLHQHGLAGAYRFGLTVVLDEFGVVAEVGERAADLFVLFVARVFALRRTVQHHDRGMRSDPPRHTMIFMDWLAAGGELAGNPCGANVRGEK